jgi:2,3-bisphosphoglycerate-dependent phosphoglycerate mutase
MLRLVLLRHGESTWNRENRFTGWEDVDLSDKGVEEAKAAGAFLADAGVAPDIVHTSLQLRAIRTAELALAACGRHWIPVQRHWRLNERHYGELQGLNKSETRQKFGEEQFMKWRRSYDTPPPPVSLDDPRHPRHDIRYADVPPEVLPASECLADVLARVLPYWDDAIVPDLHLGKLVLVAAHGNSLRALKMHLDGLSKEEVVALNIPTGFPLVYDLAEDLSVLKCAYLPDDATAAAAAAAVAQQGH